MRRKVGSRQYIEAPRHMFRAAAHALGDILQIGAIPPFVDVCKPSDEKGPPRKISQSAAIAESFRGDIRICKSFIADKDGIPSETRVYFTPAHTVLKRNPDRSFISVFRTISDLRLINLWMRKEDTFHVWVPGIAQLAERIVSL